MAVAGRVLMIPAGEWTSGNNYIFLDVTVYAGSSYVAKKNINNSTVAPPNDTEGWQLIAQGYDVSQLVTKNMIVDQIVNDSNKISSAAALYDVNQKVDKANSDFTNFGIVAPTVGTGKINTDWITSGSVNYRVVNGICQLSADIYVKNILAANTLIVSGLPITTLAKHITILDWELGLGSSDNRYLPCYITEGNLCCSIAKAGHYVFGIDYPVK